MRTGLVAFIIAVVMAARPCNTGRKPVLDNQKFNKLMLNYIDAVSDGEAFELHAYSDKKAGGGVDYAALAALHLLVKVMLQVTPTGYLKKTDVRAAVSYALSQRPLRSIQPKIPKKDLIALVEKQATGNGPMKKKFK